MKTISNNKMQLLPDNKHVLISNESTASDAKIKNLKTGVEYTLNEFFIGIHHPIVEIKLIEDWIILKTWPQLYKTCLIFLKLENSMQHYFGYIDDVGAAEVRITPDQTIYCVGHDKISVYKVIDEKINFVTRVYSKNINSFGDKYNYLVTSHYDEKRTKELGLEIRELYTLKLVEIISTPVSKFQIVEGGGVEISFYNLTYTIISEILHKAYLKANLPTYLKAVDEALPRVIFQAGGMHGLPNDLKKLIKEYLLNPEDLKKPDAILPENASNPSAEQKDPVLPPPVVAPMPQIANNRCGFFTRVAGIVGAAIISGLYIKIGLKQ